MHRKRERLVLLILGLVLDRIEILGCLNIFTGRKDIKQIYDDKNYTFCSVTRPLTQKDQESPISANTYNPQMTHVLATYYQWET